MTIREVLRELGMSTAGYQLIMTSWRARDVGQTYSLMACSVCFRAACNGLNKTSTHIPDVQEDSRLDARLIVFVGMILSTLFPNDRFGAQIALGK